MRRVLLSAAAGLALLAGSSFVNSASAAAEITPRYEQVTAFGKPATVTAIRATLFDVYGFWPVGFEPTANRAGLVQGQRLDITNPDGFVRKALMYWKFNRNTGMYEPKVSLTTYAYATPEYLADPATNPSGTISIGLTDPSGNPFINPVTNQPVGVVSPNV